MSKQEDINTFSKIMAALSVHLSEIILKHIHSLTNYESVIGIMGKPERERAACATLCLPRNHEYP